MNGMLRTALRPRWLILLALVLVAATAMAWLGSWQLGRARAQGSTAQNERIARPPVALDSVLAPQQMFPNEAVERPVTAQGQWAPSEQLLVGPRWSGKNEGVWVLTPLVLDDGSRLPVVRGWAPDGEAARRSATTLAAGPVTITGVLRPGEESDEYEPGKPPSPEAIDADLARIDPVLLIEAWPRPIFTGYVVQTGPDAATGGLSAVPPVSRGDHLALQNLSYALQWWLFAAFGMFFWLRLVRDDHRGTLAP